MIDILELGLKSGADPNKFNSAGLTPLYVAVQSGNNLVVEKLLNSEKINLNILYDSYKDNQLGIAADNDDEQVAEFFLEQGTNPNLADARGETPLLKFIRNGNAKMVKLLLQKGVDPLLKDDKGFTPLYWAVAQRNRNYEIIEAIMRYVDRESLLELAKTFKEMGDEFEVKYQKAIDNYSRAIQLNPQYMAAYFNRGNAYYGSEMYDEAIEDFTNAQKLEPNDPDIYIGRANSYQANEMHEEAIADYSKAIELSPEDANSFSAADLPIKLKARLLKPF